VAGLRFKLVCKKRDCTHVVERMLSAGSVGIGKRERQQLMSGEVSQKGDIARDGEQLGRLAWHKTGPTAPPSSKGKKTLEEFNSI